MKKNYLTIALTIIYSIVWGQVTFTEVTGTSFSPLVDGEAQFVDVDNDKDLDLIISGGGELDFMTMMNTPTTKIYKNDGAGNFTLQQDINIEAVSSSSIAVGDIDNDSDMDIFICGQSESRSYISVIYKNDGAGNFTPTTDNIIGTIQGDAEFGDVDGDKDLDLIVSGYTKSGYNTSLYENDGSGNFSLISGTPFSGTNYASVKFLDSDNDTDLDVLVAGTNGSSTFTELYLNDGSGVFSIASGMPFSGSQLGSIDVADVNGDTFSDVVISGYTGSAEIVELYINNGAGNFVKNNTSSFKGVAYSAVQFSDFDSDGDMDIISCGYNGATKGRSTKLYFNDGSGNYTEDTSISLPGNQQFRIKAADIDGDNDPDLYLSGSSNGGGANNAFLYRNNISSLSENNFLSPKLSVYPNPTSEEFSIDLGENYNNVMITVSNLNGQIIKKLVFKNTQVVKLSIEEPAGVYILNIDTGKNVAAVRLVKE